MIFIVDVILIVILCICSCFIIYFIIFFCVWNYVFVWFDWLVVKYLGIVDKWVLSNKYEM